LARDAKKPKPYVGGRRKKLDAAKWRAKHSIAQA
jgi:hypothetical protein